MAKSSTTFRKAFLFNLLGVFFCLLLLKICNTSDLSSSDLDSVTLDPSPRKSIIRGGAENDQLEFPLNLAGDIDNDGFEDFIIEVPSRNNSQGAVYVIYGGESSPSLDHNLSLESLNPATTGFIIKGNANDEMFGSETSIIGDLNKDGYDDIFIRASSKESGQEVAYVIYGGERSSMLNLSTIVLDPVTKGLKASGNVSDFFGNSLNSINGVINEVSSDGSSILNYGKETRPPHEDPKSNNCSINCNRCSSPFSCTECTNPYLLSESECVQFCPDGSFPSAGKCEAQLTLDSRLLANCPTGCSACTVDGGPDYCQPIPCYYCSACIRGYYLTGTNCRSCVTGCDTCTSSSVCTACSSGYFLSGSQCVQNCPMGKYGDAGLRVCSACLSSCESCSDASTCDSCPSGSFLFGGQCLPSCPTRTYGDTVLRECFACPSDCDTCTSSSVCTICTIPYSLLADQCVQPCPLGMFSEAGVCKDCPSGCAQCTNFTTCTVCASSYYLFLNQCLTICPPATFPSSSTGACENCPAHCTSCGSKTACKICDNGYNLKDSACGLPTSLESQAKATKAVTSAVTGAGSVLCVGSPTFPITALVSQIVQNTRYINLTVTDELAEIYKTWNTDLIAWDPPNVVHKLDNFKTSPELFSKYGLGSSFMANFWPTFMTIAIGLIVLSVSFVLKILFERGQYRGRFYSLAKKLVAGSFNFVIVQVYGCLDDILFDLVLDIKTNPFEEFFSWTSLFCAVGFLAIGCSLVFMNMRVVKRYQIIKAEALAKNNMSLIDVFNENNKYWELFYSEFNDEDFWSQSALALFIIRGTLSSLIIAACYDYPTMQTSFLVMLDGAVILFLATKKPLKELRGKLAQYYFEIITLLVHLCTFLLALQETFPSSSEPLKKILCTGIMYLNTTLIVGSLFFMGIEIYDLIRLKHEEKKYQKHQNIRMGTEEASSIVQNTLPTTNEVITTVEDIQEKPKLRHRQPVESLETSNLFSEKNTNKSFSGILIKPARILDFSTNADDSLTLQDIETGGNEIGQQQRGYQNRSPHIARIRRRTTKKKQQQQQQPSERLFLRNPARHLRDLRRPEDKK